MESLYESWEKFKEMFRLCPYHRFERWFIIHTIYNGPSYTTRMTIDVATCRTLMNKIIDQAYAFIEDVTHNHYQWGSDCNSNE